MRYHTVTAKWPRKPPQSHYHTRFDTSELPRAVWGLYANGAQRVFVDGCLVARQTGTPRADCHICDRGSHVRPSPGYRRIHRPPWVAPCVCGMLDGASRAPSARLSELTTCGPRRVPHQLGVWAAVAVVAVTALTLFVSMLLRGAP